MSSAVDQERDVGAVGDQLSIIPKQFLREHRKQFLRSWWFTISEKKNEIDRL